MCTFPDQARMSGRGCPRCGGPVVKDEDRYGPFLSCLACGWLGERGVPLGGRDLEALVPAGVLRRVAALLDGVWQRDGRACERGRQGTS